jgi:IclR family acetate operon transcriptional repressor
MTSGSSLSEYSACTPGDQSGHAAEWHDGSASVVAKVSALIGAFGDADRVLGTSEIARRTGLPKSTVHRLLHDLAQFGFLERDSHGVRLGLRMFEIGQLVPQQRDLRDTALPFMNDLRSATRQTVHLAILDHGEVVYVEILQSPDSPPLPSRVGGRLPAYATAVGKAMLAFSSATTVRDIVGGKLVRLTSRTITQPRMLMRELEDANRQGVAYDREESRAGLVCAASPLLGADAGVVGAISVSGWSSRVNLDQISRAVHTAAMSVTRSLAA